MRHVGTALVALGLAIAGIAIGFFVFIAAAITLTALLPPPTVGNESLLDVVPALIGYAAWAITAAAVFIYGWRRMRDPR